MSIQENTCVTAVCDGCSDGWDEGPWHFDSRDELTKYLSESGWVIGDRILCRDCSVKADCAATGHQWSDWDDHEREQVAYRYRNCDHCCHSETDPPFTELSLLIDAARVINALGLEDEEKS